MTDPKTSLIIATMQRTGSSWLSAQLAATGVAGNPREWLQPETILRWGVSHRLPVMKLQRAPQLALHRAGRRTHDERLFIKSVRPGSLPGYVAALRDAESTPNGVFAMQCHWDQWTLARDTWSLPASAFGPDQVWLHHWREDRFEQAVSWTIARQSDQWNSTMRARSEPVYDADAVLLRFELADRYHHEWLAYFAAHDIRPLQLTYEQLMEDSPSRLHTILSAISSEATAVTDDAPRLRIQRDERSEEWLARFTRDHAELLPRRFARPDER